MSSEAERARREEAIVQSGRVHGWAARLVLVCVTVAVALVALPGAASAAERRGGPYAVGVRSYEFVDRSRPTQPNGSYPGAPSRTLPTLLLYPARGKAGEPAVENARPLATRRFPLVVFSHGFTGTGPAYRFLLERYVQRGYVVAAPTFPLSNGNAPGGPIIADYVNQPADVSYVIDRALRLRRKHRGLAKTISRTRIGAAGHSLGAITTLGVAGNTCCIDRRIDAAVPIAGVMLPFGKGRFFAKGTPPLMLVHGTEDGTVPYSGSTAAYELAPAPKALLTLLDAPHTPFFAPWLDPIVRSTSTFLDRYLKGNVRALRRLRENGDVPGVSSLHLKLRRGASR